MRRAYYYLVSALPVLHFDQPDELNIGAYLEHIEENLLPGHRAYAWFLREWIDLTNLQWALKGHTGFLGFGRFTRDQLVLESEDIEEVPLLWQEYARQSQKEEGGAVEPLWLDYFERGAHADSALVRRWAGNELALRTALAIFRAQRLGRGLPELEGIQHPLIEEMIVNARLPDLGTTYRFPWMASVRETLDREHPLEAERRLDLLRWRLVDDQIGLLAFGLDVVLAYFVKLLILSRWVRVKQLDGYDRLCKEVLGGKFIA